MKKKKMGWRQGKKKKQNEKDRYVTLGARYAEMEHTAREG